MEGEVVFRKKLSPKQSLAFTQARPICIVAMETCPMKARYWAQTLAAIRHEVRLTAPKFVKSYMRSQKNDMADAATILGADSRPNMYLIDVKTPEQQEIIADFRLRDGPARQQTLVMNASRRHLVEFGLTAGSGPENVNMLRVALEPGTWEADDLLAVARHMARLRALARQWLTQRIAECDARLAHYNTERPHLGYRNMAAGSRKSSHRSQTKKIGRHAIRA